MLKSLFVFTFTLIAIQNGAAGQVAEKKQALPSAKPLQTQSGRSFIEGIDVPRAKPDRFPLAVPNGNTKKLQAREEKAVFCQIDGAELEQLGPLTERREEEQETGCGIEDAVKLTAFGGEDQRVSLAAPLTISCEFAKVLTQWMSKDVLPSARNRFGKQITLLTTGPGYQCRRRNNLPDGKLSEHALGKAVDILAFQMSDGSWISIEEDWGGETQEGQFLSSIHDSACRQFTTVLGPAADPNHRSHFHLDTGCHGKDCSYIICQ